VGTVISTMPAVELTEELVTNGGEAQVVVPARADWLANGKSPANASARLGMRRRWTKETFVFIYLAD
jgi:hypothetical protein